MGRTCSATPPEIDAAATASMALGDAMTGPTGDGRVGREARGNGRPRRLGDVLQERHRRHHDGDDRRARPHQAQDPRAPRAPITARRPGARPVRAGTIAEDRAHQIIYYLQRRRQPGPAVRTAGDDLAGIFAAPFKHDAFIDQAMPDPVYARRARELCDKHRRAADRRRRARRPAHRARLQLVAGRRAAGPLVLGQVHRQRPSDLGRCWARTRRATAAARSSSPARSGSRRADGGGASRRSTMRRHRLPGEDRTPRRPTARRSGRAATTHGFSLRQTGPAQMPLFLFDDDPDLRMGYCWCARCWRGASTCTPGTTCSSARR